MLGRRADIRCWFPSVLFRPGVVASTSTWRCHAFGFAPRQPERCLAGNQHLISVRLLGLGHLLAHLRLQRIDLLPQAGDDLLGVDVREGDEVLVGLDLLPGRRQLRLEPLGQPCAVAPGSSPGGGALPDQLGLPERLDPRRLALRVRITRLCALDPIAPVRRTIRGPVTPHLAAVAAAGGAQEHSEQGEAWQGAEQVHHGVGCGACAGHGECRGAARQVRRVRRAPPAARRDGSAQGQARSRRGCLYHRAGARLQMSGRSGGGVL